MERPSTRITVEQYHRMLEVGILEDCAPYELIEGILWQKQKATPLHAGSVSLIRELSAHVKQYGYHISSGQPVTIPPDNEPEPDGSIVRGSIRDRIAAKRHPYPTEVACVFEVSDGSLESDRTTKQRIYADSGIPQYVIVNLRDIVVERYSTPLRGRGRYQDVSTLRFGEAFRVRLDENAFLDLEVDAILPNTNEK